MSKKFGGVAFVVIMAAAVSSARADRFFEIFSFSNTGSTSPIETSKTSLTHAIGDFMNAQGSLAPIGGNGIFELSPGKPFGDIFNNVPLVIDSNPSSNSAFVAFSASRNPIIITGTSAQTVGDQVRNVFVQDLKGDWGQEVKSLDNSNPNMPIAGNPQSSTAIIATAAYNSFGAIDTLGRTTLSGGDDFNVTLDGDYGLSRANAINGNYADVNLGLSTRFDDNFALSLVTVMQWRVVGRASSYTFGEIVADPINLINRVMPGASDTDKANYATPEDMETGFPFDLFESYSWRVTPWATAALAASWDEVMGTILVGGGLTSSLALYNGPITFTLNDQVSYVNNVGVKIGNYNFNDPINQMVIKNGVDIAWQPGTNGIFIDSAINLTDLLFKASTPYYFTPSFGVGFKFNANTGIRISGTADLSPKYTSYGGQATFWLTF
jgi:hypothetical protein